MTNYSELVKTVNIPELVKALRGLANGIWKNCEYTWFGGEEKVFADAAAAIEELQQIADYYKQTAKDYCKEACEYKAQLPKRGKWVRVQEVDIPGEIHPVAFKCMCPMCRNEYVFPRIPKYCPDCGSMNKAKMEVHDGAD